ncbi:Arc family DNA-binding protein [Mesorhizobium sp. M0244]|uniref:Arc family DNA-binding protein n=1 Tax=Mesorhizobium sp. M0244 TaxID=2956926 RepID=UPI0033387319
MAQQKQPSDLLEKFVVRMPDGMRDRIAEAAQKEMRTMNGQINFMLQKALDARGDEHDNHNT